MNLQVRFISKRTVQAIILLNSTKRIMSGEDAVQGTDPLVLMGQFLLSYRRVHFLFSCILNPLDLIYSLLRTRREGKGTQGPQTLPVFMQIHGAKQRLK